MARLWRNEPETREGKYLVIRRDGTIPEWEHFVLGSRDRASVAALRGYANEAESLGYDPKYVDDIRALADEWEAALDDGKVLPGDADAPRHRTDDPDTIAKMRGRRGT